MARKKKVRFIQMAPHISGYEPVGTQRVKNETIIINLEEYEALKLCDYEKLTQTEAAKLMNISRPTLTRIYESVRQKIARAFVEGNKIVFEGGNIEVIEWFKCGHCEIIFTIKTNGDKKCPFCLSKNISLNNVEG